MLKVFERSDCLLESEQLVAWEIHLGSKPESLQRLSAKLNLSLDSFVFLDDNYFEVADVSQMLPEVLVIHVPQSDDDFTRLLQHSWFLDVHGHVTREDQQRTDLYRQNAARRAERERHHNLQDFLEALQVEVRILQPTVGDKARLSQLCGRTNQFNTTQLRLSESEVEAWCANLSTRHVLASEVKDKFGDYGVWVNSHVFQFACCYSMFKK